MADTQTSEWIEHDGKGMPVPPETKVYVRFADSETDERDMTGQFIPPERADWWGESWVCDPEREISHYRVVKP